MLTGLTANLPVDCLLNTGALFYSKASVATKIGVTEGAPDFDPAIENGIIEFDGRRSMHWPLVRRNGFKPVMKGTIKELGPAASGGQIALLDPGSSEAAADGSGTKLITPKSAGVLYGSGDIILNLRWIFERGSGGFAAILLPVALCTKWSIKGVDKKEAQISFEFEGMLDLGSDPGAPPYKIEIRTALPTT
jgi:hypothetical protein